MAAGNSAPAVFVSLEGVFFEHSTIGVGTVMGSTPFSLLVVCSAASLAVSGFLYLDGWLLAREGLFLFLALAILLVILDDNRIFWCEAPSRFTRLSSPHSPTPPIPSSHSIPLLP
jgi:Ca2+/Na+ antiporter